MKLITLLSIFIFVSCSSSNSVNQRDGKGETLLLKASGLGNESEVSKLIEAGADVNVMDVQMGVTPLHRAAQSGNTKVIKILLKNGAFIDDRSAVNGHTPLLDAAFYKRYDAIKIFLKNGADPNLKNTLGLNVWDWAKRQKDSRIVELLKVQEELDKKLIKKQRLLAAVKENNIIKTQRLLKEGEDPNEAAKDGNTPLLWASKFGYTEIVKVLLLYKANPNKVGKIMKATPGHKAAFFGHADVLKELIKHGLNLDAQGPYNGYTALHDSILNSHIDASKVLILAGASIDIEGIDGESPLSLAKKLGLTKLLELKD